MNEMSELGIESIEMVVALASSEMGLGSGVIRLVEWVGDVVLFGLARGRFLKETSYLRVRKCRGLATSFS
jgi:hypothetical protein